MCMHTHTHTHPYHPPTHTQTPRTHMHSIHTYTRANEEGTSESMAMQCSRSSLPMGRSSRGPPSASSNQTHTDSGCLAEHVFRDPRNAPWKPSLS